MKGKVKSRFRYTSGMEPDRWVRFIDFRFDGDRTVTGTAMPYGDVAELPWGKERFEPQAFGEVGSLDISMNIQHNRDRMVARTGGSGLTLDDSPQALRFNAKLIDDTDGNDAMKKIQGRLIRGVSVEFMPTKYRFEAEDPELMIIEEAQLRGLGLVDKPAYPKAMISSRQQLWQRHKQEDVTMTEEQIRKMIQEALAARAESTDPVNVDEMVSKFMESSQTQVRDAVAEAIKERDEAQAATAKAEGEKAAAEKAATDERAQVEADAEARAELIVQVRSLLPDDYDLKGKTRKEILVTAAGQEVADAADRSEDYLLAKVEDIIERREAASTGQTTTRTNGTGGTSTQTASNAPVSIHQVFTERRRAELSSK